MDNANNNNKSVNFSCRLSKETYDVLESEALKKRISMNSLINSTLGKYAVLGRHSGDIELVSLTKRAVKRIFETMDDDTIKDIADDVGG